MSKMLIAFKKNLLKNVCMVCSIETYSVSFQRRRQACLLVLQISSIMKMTSSFREKDKHVYHPFREPSSLSSMFFFFFSCNTVQYMYYINLICAHFNFLCKTWGIRGTNVNILVLMLSSVP